MAPITKTQWASFIPVIWAQRILDQLRSSIVLARLAGIDFQDEISNIGDTVRIGKIGALSAVDKVAGTAVTRQNPSATSQDLVLDHYKIVPFVIEDVARAQANPQAMDKQIGEAVRAIAEQFESDLFAALIAAAGTTVGTAGSDATEALLLLIRKALSDGKVPMGMPKSAVWSTKDVNALLTTSTSKFTKANERGDAGEALREGSVGRLYGLDHYESQLVPIVTGTPNTTQNVGFAHPALQVAVRPLPPPPEGVGAKGAVVSDPVSGLSIRMVSQYDIDNTGLATNVELLYGSKVVRPEWVVYAKA